MLYWVRQLKGSWIARIFSVLMILAFIGWGASSALPMLAGGTTAVAHIGGKPVDVTLVQAEYQNELNQASQKGQPDAAARQQIAQAALGTVLRQQAIGMEEARVGIVAPDAALRTQINAIPVFQTNGVFDKNKFASVLQQNSLSPDRFLQLKRDNLKNTQLLPALVAGAAPAQALVNQVFSFITQSRVAETVDVPVNGQTPPAAPGDAVLQRYWKNHPAQFTSAAYRTAKIVILSPQLLAPKQPVSDAQLNALYAQTAASESVPASRSVQVLTTPDAAIAGKLKLLWQGGADWARMQAAAAKDNAAAVALDHAQADQIPSAALSKAVFAANPDDVVGPVQGDLGYYVFKVTDAQAAGAPKLAQLAPKLKAQIQLQEAQAQVAKDVDNVQDALAGQTPLDQLPGNLDLTAVEGTLDANGNTPDGSAAPIPGGAKLRDAIVKAIFAAQKSDPAQLTAGPDGAYFAFTLDAINPPALQPYDQVKSQVLAAWTQDEMSHAAEAKAASMLAEVKAGRTLEQTATAMGYTVSIIAPMTRTQPANGITPQMVPVLFSLKLGQPTMLQTSSGFTVAVLSKITQPKPADDPQDVASITQSLTKSLQDDVAASFLSGLQARDNVQVDPKLFAQIYQ
jgi:peptidyl-prolyl cis-trans isomerase D